MSDFRLLMSLLLEDSINKKKKWVSGRGKSLFIVDNSKLSVLLSGKG